MIFKEGKIIETIRKEKNGRQINVILRFPKRSDAKDALKLLNSLVGEKALLSIINRKTLEEEIKWIEKIVKKVEKKKMIFIAAEVNGKYMGGVGIKAKNSEASKHIGVLGIALDASIRRKGIGEHMIKLAMKLAKKHLKIEILRLGVFKENPAQKLYKKLGFKKCGHFPKERKQGKTYYDEIIMYKFL